MASRVLISGLLCLTVLVSFVGADDFVEFEGVHSGSGP